MRLKNFFYEHCKEIFSFLESLITIFGLSINLDFVNNNINIPEQFVFSFREYSLLPVIMFPILFHLYKNNFITLKSICRSALGKVCVLIPAVIFSVFWVLGYSFEKTGSWDLLFLNGVQMLKAMLEFGAVLIAACNILTFIYNELDGLSVIKKGGNRFVPGIMIKKIQVFYINHIGIVTFAGMLLVYIPYIIASYPGIFMGDTPDQIAQGFNLPSKTSRYLNLVSEEMLLNNHHPIAHTLLIHLCLEMGGGIRLI